MGKCGVLFVDILRLAKIIRENLNNQIFNVFQLVFRAKQSVHLKHVEIFKYLI